MPSNPKDPTEVIRLRASKYPEVDEGTACTQSSFKTNKKAFLYVGMQGGRYKAMFKLKDSLAQATKLAKEDSDLYQVGTGGWVTARFTAEKPLSKSIWTKWLDESYGLSCPQSSSKTSAKKKATTKKTTSKKKSASKKRKTTARKKN
jgi:hypothetical protein